MSSFNADMEARRLPDKRLRASAHVVPLPPVEPGETVCPVDWHGKLDADTYRLTWGAREHGQTEETFTFEGEGGELHLRGQRLVSPAPTSAPEEGQEGLVAQAIANLAGRLGIREKEITVTGVKSVEFSDASIGVPEPGQSYG